jgi:hypothetical protein
MGILKASVLFLRAMLIPKVHLVVENLALRQRLAVLGQSVKRPKLRPRDRVFWVCSHDRRHAVHFKVTTIPGHIYRWIATHQHHVKWNRRRRARSSPFAKPVDYITDTRVLRD